MSVKSASLQSGGPKDGATTNVAVYLSVEHANAVLLTTAEICRALRNDRRRPYIAPLSDFDPLLARWSRPWPGRDDVIRARRRRKVREVRQHDHRHRHSRPAPAPHDHPLARSKIGPDEVGVIDRQCRRSGSQLYQGLDIGVDPPAHQGIITVGVALLVGAGRCSQPAEVHWVYLLARALVHISVLIEKVVLVGELFPGEKHWNPDCRHQANESQLDPLLDLLVRHTV